MGILVSNSKYLSNNSSEKHGIFKCEDKRCKVCKLYLQECESFMTAKPYNWKVRCHVTCNSKNALYYLVCTSCEKESNTGKTDDLRARTNNHITACRHGKSSDKFDNHVYKCQNKDGKIPREPYFRLYVFMVLSNYEKLRNYERKLHLEGHDTINR